MFITGDLRKVTLKMSDGKTESHYETGLPKQKSGAHECGRFFNLD